MREKLSRQIGLRFIIEGMVGNGGDLSAVNVWNFAPRTSGHGHTHWIDTKQLQRDFDMLKTKLASKRTVLVGHNLFMDLIYLYHTFLGVLPDKVEDFQQRIHELFPFIVDTKYLATQNNIDNNAKSGLEELDKEMAKVPVPLIGMNSLQRRCYNIISNESLSEIHNDHPKYDSRTAYHEAGYDSYLTARVLIRKSAELESSGTYVDYDPKGFATNQVVQTSLESSEPSSKQLIQAINLPSQNATLSKKSAFHQSPNGQFSTVRIGFLLLRN